MATTTLIGVAGGVGTTRTAVEFAAGLARADRSVAVFDAAYATQGLAEYVEGRIEPDVTRLAVDPDATTTAATHELEVDTPGHAVVVPAAASFERLARAKTADASQRLAERITATADRFDHVLVDVPPVAANPHVACVTAADRRVAVAPGTPHGADAHRRLVDRLADLDCTLDATCAVGETIPPADCVVPTGPRRVADAPTTPTDDAFAARTIDAIETALDTTLAVEFDEDSLLDRVRASVATD